MSATQLFELYVEFGANSITHGVSMVTGTRVGWNITRSKSLFTFHWSNDRFTCILLSLL